jgi:taurine---2-oxoglutarate transaminase
MNSLPSQAIVDLTHRYGLYDWTSQNSVEPLVISRAKGVYFWTVDGRRFLDFNSQLMCVNVGHSDERIIAAITRQLERLAYVSPSATHEPRAHLHELLAQVTPEPLVKSFFTLGGADANETAVKIARQSTGRRKVLARYRSYHGATAGAISLTGEPRRWPNEPGISGVIHVQDPYRYRCRWCSKASACNLDCLSHVEDVIQLEGPHTVAAVLVEPVTGTNGLIIPPDGYLQGLRGLCDKYDILLIADEVMSGFGRTGEWFAVDHWKVSPDLMTLAKGLTSAYLPLGAVVMTAKVASHFDDETLYAGLTYNSHPVCCAAAIAAIEVYQSDGLVDNAKHLGDVLSEEMQRLKKKHPSVGDIRHIGLFAIFELVKSRTTKEPLVPFNASRSQMGPMIQLSSFLRNNGLYAMIRWNTLFVNPPLCIDKAQLYEGLEIIDRALEITDAATLL